MLKRRSERKPRSFHEVYIILALVLSGCSDSVTLEELQEPAPEPVESISPQLDDARKTMELIGPEGGSVVMEDANGLLYTLDIAPGILPVDVEISMTPVVDIPGLHFAEEFLVGVQFEPEGLYLVEPAMLTLELPPDTDISNLTAFGWRGAGDSVYLEPIRQPSPSLGLPIAHFSGEGVVLGDPDDALDLIVPDESIETLYKAEIARVADEVSFGICGLDAECYIDPEYVDEFVLRFPPLGLEVFGEWLDEINRQIDNPEKLNEPLLMMREYFAWTATAGLLLCDGETSCSTIRDNFGIRIDSIRDKATQQVMKLFEEHEKDCDDYSVYKLLFDNIIFSMGDSASGFGKHFAGSVDVEDQAGIIVEEIKSLFRCNLEIVVSGFPDTFEINAPDEEISVQLNNKSDVLELGLENISVSLSNKADGCSEIDGSTDTTKTYQSDSSGQVAGVKMNGNDCKAESKVILDIDVADNLVVHEPERFFFGHSVRLEAEVTDPCAPAAPKSTRLAGSFKVNDTCEGVVVTVSPGSMIMAPGSSQQFTATVTGATDPSVAWTATGGIIDPSGLFTASHTAGSYTVTATSEEDATVSDSASVTIGDPIPDDISGAYTGTAEEWVGNGSFLEDEHDFVGFNLEQNEDQIVIEFFGSSQILALVPVTGTISGAGIEATTDPSDCHNDTVGQDEGCRMTARVSFDGAIVTIEGRVLISGNDSVHPGQQWYDFSVQTDESD